MNAISIATWSERRQVLAVILMAGVVMFLLWFFALTPLYSRLRRLERRIEDMRSQLTMKNYYVGEDVLEEWKQDAQKHNRRLHDEWTAAAERLSGFTNYHAIMQSPVGHIDFKVALFEIRHRLMKKAREKNITLPPDLGMDAVVLSDEDARKLILQLRSVEKIVDMTLDLKISMLRTIRPRPQILHRLAPGDEPYIEEYPFEIEFYGTIENLYAMFDAIMDPEHVFLVRQIRVDATSPSRPDQVSVKAVLSAMLFLKDPDDMNEKPKQETTKPRPRGF